MPEDPHRPAISPSELRLQGLRRAQNLGDEAASWGFDWPTVDGALAKVDEEIAEVRAELAHPTPSLERVRAELGDLLFAVVNVARHLNLDAQSALDEASDTFERRITSVRAQATEAGHRPEDLSLDELEAFWRNAKAAAGLDSPKSSDL
ncbi:hypothetical protein EA187_04805 [Lujinxingia sediminis]|uniref:NTP pyrophosphohydrolase MazG-like domain-containing protein n=1 Tax=Lujinxingia sediminis TaxID=2480984 RepID=A0ABY0CYP9_9DELT|nr:MazG nucleotide pyrophosphohydrolase domain-containing protein [Lujinxingia sediminis]RVU48754.1 hypothetical protein EA187_04805 [Lujinxingia sediminis]